MTKIKVCGLKRSEDISYVNEARPDFAGFIVEFPRSHRSIERDRLRRLAAELDEGIIPVGVFVDAPVEVPAQLLNEGVISMVQLHGHESEDYILQLKCLIADTEKSGKTSGKEDVARGKIIKAFSVKDADDIDRAKASSADYVLLDQGAGGSGRVFDWSLAENGDIGRDFFLAGGLDAANLPDAIKRLNPFAVDLSSSLETGGLKDREKIIKAVKAVRQTVRR